MTAMEIKTRRLELGMAQEDLARKIGVAMMTVWRWENGKASPSRHLVKLLEKALK